MALVIGTNCGFCAVAPTADPATGAFQFIGIDAFAFTCRFTSPADAVNITEIGWYTRDATEEANWEAAVFADDGATVPGEAGTRLHHVDTNAKGTTAGWKVRSGLDWAIDPSTDYWLAIQLDNTATSTTCDRETSGGGGYDSVFSATAMPDPFGGGALADADGNLAIYVVYGTGGGGGDTAAPHLPLLGVG